MNSAPINRGRAVQQHSSEGPTTELKEVVLGLHWTPPEPADGPGRAGEPANLDALCVLLDEKRRVVEVIDPRRQRNENGSVVHTGDSRTGASVWDDERIFVFLTALPSAVSLIAFAVASVDGRPFSEVPGASCHVSDAATERELIRIELTHLDRHTAHCVATLQRGPGGAWRVSSGAAGLNGFDLEALLASSRHEK